MVLQKNSKIQNKLFLAQAYRTVIVKEQYPDILERDIILNIIIK